MANDKLKARCAGPNHSTSGSDVSPRIEVKVTEEPYNPEWPIRVIDAAVFCSYDCLREWSADRQYGIDNQPRSEF